MKKVSRRPFLAAVITTYGNDLSARRKFSRVEVAASSTREKVVRFPDTNFSSDSLTAGHWQVGGLPVTCAGPGEATAMPSRPGKNLGKYSFRNAVGNWPNRTDIGILQEYF
jgi:hypothetical protein